MVGFGVEENDEQSGGNTHKGDEKGDCTSGSTYGEVSQLNFVPVSPKMANATAIMDIPAFTKDLTLFPYHKILE